MHPNVSFEFAGHTIRLETGKIAPQAQGAVWLQAGDTILLAAASCSPHLAHHEQSFLSLTTHYQEKLYGAGRIPGNHMRRQSRRTEHETLVARSIDRCLRPLLPMLSGSVEVTVEALSIDRQIPPAGLAILAASCATLLSGLPLCAPVASLHLYRDAKGELLHRACKSPTLELLVAGHEEGFVMLEGESSFLGEAQLLEALGLAREQLATACQAQRQLYERQGHKQSPLASCKESVGDVECQAQLADIFASPSVSSRKHKRKQWAKQLQSQEPSSSLEEWEQRCCEAEKRWLRQQALDSQRLGGRGPHDLRPIACEVDLLPRPHGSALFSRGQTQVLGAVTLGQSEDEQTNETIHGLARKHFYVHYNFPGYATGKAGRFGVWGRREIGHGVLTERGLRAALPPRSEFPQTINLVAEVTSANGSTSMASVCSGTLALLAAGVPLRQSIAGVAVGLVVEGSESRLLLDPSGEEDLHFDMDLKVCGSREGITALQMDIKVPGVTVELLAEALELAKQGRLEILEEMEGCIAEARELCPRAPHNKSFEIDPALAKELLGHGGKKLRKLRDKSGAKIHVNPSGKLQVQAPHRESFQRFLQELEVQQEAHGVAAPSPVVEEVKDPEPELEVGALYTGSVTHITRYGAFVEILPGVVGLLHVSEMSEQQPVEIEEFAKKGETLTVKLIQVDKKGRIGLSLRQAAQGA